MLGKGVLSIKTQKHIVTYYLVKIPSARWQSAGSVVSISRKSVGSSFSEYCFAN